MNRYKEILSGIESSSSLSEEISAVTSRGRKIKSRRRHIGAACIAAAVVLTTSVTAAAYNWDIRAITGAWFGGKTEYIADNMLKVTVLNEENSFDGLIIEPKGAIYDKNLAIVFMDLIRTDGGIFNCTPYEAKTMQGEIYIDPIKNENREDIPQYKFGSLDMYIPCPTPPNLSRSDQGGFFLAQRFLSKAYRVEDNDPSDEKITMAFCMDSQYLDKDNNTVYIAFNSLNAIECYFSSMNGKGTLLTPYVAETISGSWKGNVVFEDIKMCGSKQIPADKNTVMKVAYQNGKATDHEFTVTELSVSQISVNAKMYSENPDESMFLIEFGIGEVIMKDGSVHPICPDLSVPNFITENSGNLVLDIVGLEMPDKWEINATYMLQESIDPENVSAVKIGDTIFEIN